jgi:Cytochrome P450
MGSTPLEFSPSKLTVLFCSATPPLPLTIGAVRPSSISIWPNILDKECSTITYTDPSSAKTILSRAQSHTYLPQRYINPFLLPPQHLIIIQTSRVVPPNRKCSTGFISRPLLRFQSIIRVAFNAVKSNVSPSIVQTNSTRSPPSLLYVDTSTHPNQLFLVPSTPPKMDLLLLEKALLGLFAAITLAIVIAKLHGKRLRLPPGPMPVPIFGNWLQVGDDLNHRNLAALARKFGDVLLLRMGQRNLVVVSSPPLAREVLHTQGVEFGSRTRNVVFDIFTGKGQDMVFTVYGDHWRKMRRIMTVPFFTNKVVQQYHPGWEAEAQSVVDDVRADPKAATEGIVLRKRLQLMMYNNMYRIMFDRRFESLDDPLFLQLRALNNERSRLAQSFEYNYGDFIPILRPFLRGYLKICKEVKERRLQLFKDYFLEERK